MCITDQIPGGDQFGLHSWASQTEAINKLADQGHWPEEAGTQSWAEDNHWAQKTGNRQKNRDISIHIAHSDPSGPSHHTHLSLPWNTAFTSLNNTVHSDTHLLHKLSLERPPTQPHTQHTLSQSSNLSGLPLQVCVYHTGMFFKSGCPTTVFNDTTQTYIIEV